MEWLFKPKVQLGLLVNFAFVMFTVVSSLAGANAPPRWRPAVLGELPAPVPVKVLPPLSSGKVLTYDENGRTQVSLYHDLTLVKKADFTLTLSPSFSARTNPLRDLSAVTLRFIRFAREDPRCPGECPLVIDADGARVWPARGRTSPAQWQREDVPGSTATSASGPVEMMPAEILTTEIPYDVFLEMLLAERVKVSLGPDKADLTPEQREAMRDMHRQVTGQRQKAVILNSH
ncbi:MAG TPA: hypothetical protein VM936_08665 [Pyrinomonadaceae bacterium]|jgi:hypothetical protein|nr:hypothetical protein [Pyrinomonadaceae bacterium]